MRLLEGVIFIGLAGVAHLGIWASTSDPQGSSAAGSKGQHVQTVSAALPAHAALVARWTRPPDVTHAPAALAPPPVSKTPGQRLPDTHTAQRPHTPAPLTAPDTFARPIIDTTPAQTLPDPKLAETRPKARPPQPDQPARRKQVAAGTGAQTAQGEAGRTSIASQNASQTKALMALWGGKINAKLQRNMVYPVGTSARGTAKLALTVHPSGKLANVALTQTAGDAALDRAALRAATRAGRFAPAPEGLTKESYVFSISLTFSRD